MTKLWQMLIICLYWLRVSSSSDKPHIIIILVDDLGWNDLGYQGSDQIQTPNIDALAYSGMILNRHYVLPTCTPSRTALLTGYYPIRTGMQGFPLRAGENRNVPLSFKLKPSFMKQLGYKTHMVGKWHLGFQTYNHVPNKRGFDSFFGYYNGYVDYYNYTYVQNLMEGGEVVDMFVGYDFHLNDDVYKTPTQDYATRVYTKRAVDIIRKHDESLPLYLYFSHLATHTGNEEKIGIQVSRDADVNKTYSHVKDYGRRIFAGCLEELDKSVGVIVETLKEKNMLSNSIILIMSDNGAHTVSVDMSPNWSSNWPLAGIKFTMFEGGVRGAGLIWSPLLPKGVINKGFIHITDWLPTLYSAAGGNVEDLGMIDGIDQWGALQSITSVKRDHILINIDEAIDADGIILGNRWKLLKGGFQRYGHYDWHWGKEENVAPNPEYNFESILQSQTGRIIQSLPEYKNVLTLKRMQNLRGNTKVQCKPPEPPNVLIEDGFIEASSDGRCKDYCLFDIIKDPCELNNIQNEEIIKTGLRILNDYKATLVPQILKEVDPASNPEYFHGSWMPWDNEYDVASQAKDFTGQCENLPLLFILTWYYLKEMQF